MSDAPKLTFAQRRLLERLIANPGSAVSIKARERSNPLDGPTFHGLFLRPRCPTCGHSAKEPTSWRTIHHAAEAGFLKQQGCDVFTADDITPAGREALARTGRRR